MFLRCVLFLSLCCTPLAAQKRVRTLVKTPSPVAKKTLTSSDGGDLTKEETALLAAINEAESKISRAKYRAALEQEIALMRLRLRELQVTYSPEWPEIKALQKEINDLTHEISGIDSKNDSTDWAAVLARLYGQAVKNSRVMEVLRGNLARNYSLRMEDASSAPQATQVANETSVRLQMLLIAQNQRIIELLEQLTKRK